MNISLLTYTHSKCFDLHQAYFNRLDKHFSNLGQHIVLSDKNINYKCENIIYNDHDKYPKQVFSGLDLIKNDYVIYSQEDYILFEDVDTQKLIEFTELMKSNDIDFIRLINSGLDGLESSFNNQLLDINQDSKYFFSTQATIWKRKTFQNLFKISDCKTIFDEPENSKFLRQINAKGLCVNYNLSHFGGHANCSTYNYIATALVKGRWNYSEYKEQLDKVFSEFNIDKNVRGVR